MQFPKAIIEVKHREINTIIPNKTELTSIFFILYSLYTFDTIEGKVRCIKKPNCMLLKKLEKC